MVCWVFDGEAYVYGSSLEDKAHICKHWWTIILCGSEESKRRRWGARRREMDVSLSREYVASAWLTHRNDAVIVIRNSMLKTQIGGFLRSRLVNTILTMCSSAKASGYLQKMRVLSSSSSVTTHGREEILLVSGKEENYKDRRHSTRFVCRRSRTTQNGCLDSLGSYEEKPDDHWFVPPRNHYVWPMHGDESGGHGNLSFFARDMHVHFDLTRWSFGYDNCQFFSVSVKIFDHWVDSILACTDDLSSESVSSQSSSQLSLRSWTVVRVDDVVCLVVM